MTASGGAVRLVHVADYGGPYRGSFVPMLLSVLDAALARGWEVETVFSPVASGRAWLTDLERRGIPVSFVPPRPRRQAAAALAAIASAAGDATTIVHTHFTSFDVASVRAFRGRRDARIVWHVHEFRPATVATRLRRYAKFALGRGRVDAVLCVGADSVEDLRAAHVVGRDRILHAPNAIDTDAFPLVVPEARRAARERLGIAPEGRVALHFGRDWRLKGGDVFVRALARLRADDADVHGISVWAGPEARADAAACGVEGAVSFVPAAEGVQDLYAAADVFVSCSRHEGDSFAVLEALASGLGVVVAEPSAPPAEIPSRRSVPLAAEAVAAAVAELLARPGEQAGLDARAARAWAERTIALPAYAERTMQVYDRLLAGDMPAV